MTRALFISWLASQVCLFESSAQAGPIAPSSDDPLSRDAYVGVISLNETYLSNFKLFATGIELVKFGTPPLALTDVQQPTSVADLSGFTVTDVLDHRVVFLSFENLSNGGLFSSSAEISVLTITPQPSAPLFELSFEATLASGFGGLPVTTVTGSYVYNALAPPTSYSHDSSGTAAQYAILSSAVTISGTPYATTGGWISIQDNLGGPKIPEPASLLLMGLGIVGIAGWRLGSLRR